MQYSRGDTHTHTLSLTHTHTHTQTHTHTLTNTHSLSHTHTHKHTHTQTPTYTPAFHPHPTAHCHRDHILPLPVPLTRTAQESKRKYKASNKALVRVQIKCRAACGKKCEIKSKREVTGSVSRTKMCVCVRDLCVCDLCVCDLCVCVSSNMRVHTQGNLVRIEFENLLGMIHHHPRRQLFQVDRSCDVDSVHTQTPLPHTPHTNVYIFTITCSQRLSTHARTRTYTMHSHET